MKTWN